MVNTVKNDPASTKEQKMAAIKDTVAQFKKEHPDMTPQQVAEYERVLTDVLVLEKGPAESMGIGAPFIEGLYTIGYQAFKGGDYATALPIFTILAQIDPLKPRYLAGMASVYFAQRKWVKAQLHFLTAAYLEPEDPMLFFYAAECAVMKKNLPEALQLYEIVIQRGEQNQLYAPIVTRTKMTIEGIKKAINTG